MRALNNWINGFVPASAMADAETLRVHRLFVTISFIASFFFLCYCIPTIYIQGHSFLLTLSLCALVFAVLPFLLHRGIGLAVLSNIFVATLAMAYCLLVFMDGGIKTANVTPWIIILPAAAMMMQGIKTAFVWMVICLGIVLVYSALYYQGIHFDTLFDESKDPVYRTLSLSGFVLCCFAIIGMFENAKNKVLEQLRVRNIALQELDKEKNNFLSIVAHDLKNPLGNIRMFAELLARADTPDEKRQQYSANIVKTSDRMFELVKKLVDVNLIESGLITIELTRIDLNELVQDYLLQVQQLATMRQIKLIHELPAQPVYIDTDVQRLEQVLENYISNALKYSPAHSTVCMRITENPKYTELAVIDEGEGISSEDQQKLFKAFGVTDAIPRNGEHKQGLGLAVVKKIGTELKAETGCRSEKGEGSQFYIRFSKQG